MQAPILPFATGQFTRFGLEINGERVQCVYSYVNIPDSPDLELCLVTAPDSELSLRLIALKSGDEIQVVGEAVDFLVLDEVSDRDMLWVLVIGTTIDPHLSILQLGKDLNRFKNSVLVHVVRYTADLNCLPSIQTLEKRYEDKLHVQAVINRETVTDSLTGHVSTLIESGKLEKAARLPIDKETCHAMFYGDPQMIRDAQRLLKDTRQMTKHLHHQPSHTTIEHCW